MHSGHARRCGRARGHRPHGARGGGPRARSSRRACAQRRASGVVRAQQAIRPFVCHGVSEGEQLAWPRALHIYRDDPPALRLHHGELRRARGEGGLRDALVTKARRPRVDRHPRRLPVEANVVDACIGEGCAQCAVRKDAGDDADVTDGVARVRARGTCGVGHGRCGQQGQRTQATMPM